jgi:hypothetical protein
MEGVFIAIVVALNAAILAAVWAKPVYCYGTAVIFNTLNALLGDLTPWSGR